MSNEIGYAVFGKYDVLVMTSIQKNINNNNIRLITLRKNAHVVYCNLQMKIFVVFLIFVQKIDCGYTLEPPK